MRELSTIDRATLINAIAAREGTAKEIAKWYDVTEADLRQFVDENREAIQVAHDAMEASGTEETQADLVTPTELAQLWIGNKFARLHRYELVADYLFNQVMNQRSMLAGAELATVLRELRFYMTAAANELGQLLHRGAGEGAEGDTMSVDIQGVDIDQMR